MTQNDYLSHLVLYGGLTDALKTFKDGEQFQLLDLGCGDAHYIADALQRSGAGGRLRQYTGVDLAGDALKVRVSPHLLVSSRHSPACLLRMDFSC
jgi:SAM-dependent methyltransferase